MNIEEGKFYRTRGGNKVGPIVKNTPSDQYPWTARNGLLTWSSDGEYDIVIKNHPNDLVDEWTDEPVPAPAPDPSPQPAAPRTPHPYAALWRILDEAYEQAASGKGKERHANGKPFPDQPIMEIGRMVGLGGHAFQIAKKAQEAVGMAGRGEYAAARAELLGAIVYAAAGVLLMDEAAGRAKHE